MFIDIEISDIVYGLFFVVCWNGQMYGDWVYFVVEYLLLVEEIYCRIQFDCLLKWYLVVFLYDVLEYVIGDMIFLVKVVLGSEYG